MVKSIWMNNFGTKWQKKDTALKQMMGRTVNEKD